MNPKQRAAEASIQFIQSGMIVGLGTGSTADFLLIALADAIRQGKLSNIRGVPTSRQTELRAGQLGIPVATLAQCPTPDLTIDGADEVAPNLDLIKGLGGALVREKIVAQNSKRLIIIADASKRVTKLGTNCPLPVEVVQFAHESHVAFFKQLGAVPTLRKKPDGSPFITDNGNFIYDCKFPAIERPAELESALLRRAGVVDSGLFLGMAERALVADENGVVELKR